MASREDIEARLRAKANAPAPPPLEATRAFLRSYCNDADSVDDVRDEAARAAAYNPRPVQAALRAIDAVIANPPRDGTLSYIIAVDANRQLADPSDAGALDYLRRIAGVLRDVLTESGGSDIPTES
jgi:hypothetical protein